jgi:hypothetical protein
LTVEREPWKAHPVVAQPVNRRRLAWTLGIGFFVVAVVPIALFYGLDFRLTRDSYPVPCWQLKSDIGEASDWWLGWAFLGIFAGGMIAYAAVVLFAPGGLGRTRWRFAFALPIAALFFATLSGWFLYPQCSD